MLPWLLQFIEVLVLTTGDMKSVQDSLWSCDTLHHPMFLQAPSCVSVYTPSMFVSSKPGGTRVHCSHSLNGVVSVQKAFSKCSVSGHLCGCAHSQTHGPGAAWGRSKGRSVNFVTLPQQKKVLACCPQHVHGLGSTPALWERNPETKKLQIITDSMRNT